MKKAQSQKKKRLLVGITGGIGAGKSLVADILRALGYLVFSADEIAREIVARGSPALEEIRALFGEQTIRADGSLDRKYLRSLVSQDAMLRRQLEAITHPRIQARAQALTNEAFAKGAEIVFYEAPLLFEAKSDRQMDKVICVHASDETRIGRIMARDQCSRDQAEKWVANQMPQAEKMQRSDYLLENDSDRESVKILVKELAQKLETLRPCKIINY